MFKLTDCRNVNCFQRMLRATTETLSITSVSYHNSLNIFNFVEYIRCSCSCPLLLTIFGTLLSRRKSHKHHDILVFVAYALHLPLVNMSASKHGRRSFLYSAMTELVCNGQLWATAVPRQLRSYKVGQREYFPATVC